MNRFCCGALVVYLWLSGFSVSIPAAWGAEPPVFSKVVRFSGLFPCELVCDGERNLIIAQPGIAQAPMMVTKLNASGGVVWTKSFPGYCTECHAIAVDSRNNILVTGYFGGSGTFGSTTLQTAGTIFDSDLFVLKLDPAGNVLWVKQAARDPEPCTAAGMAVGTDSAGNVYVGGSFRATCDFGRIRLSGRRTNSSDGFLAKWTAAGDVLWAARLGESATPVSGNVAIDTQTQGQPSPHMASSLVVGSQGDCRLHCGTQLWMYRADGAFSTASAVVSASSSTSASTGGTALDAADNSYVTGDLGNAAGLCKVNPQGQVLWSKSLGVSGSGKASGYDVTVDRGGNAIIAGSFEGTLQAGSATLASAGGSDIFVAAFSPNGDLLWATTAGGPGNDMCRGVTANYDGKIWIAGTYGAQYGTGGHAATFGDISLPASTDGKKVYVAALENKGS